MAKKKKTRATHKTFDLSLPIFQLKITLDNSEPAIWRRMQTHNCTLAELHAMIQTCMGWEDDHLHAFEVGKQQYADRSRGGGSYGAKDSRSVRLGDLADRKADRFAYEYDFGDSWRHTIEIESTLPAEDGVRYPRCIDGQRACPPEDCGGVYGYEDFLHDLAHPEEADEERLDWLGEDFDPEAFSLAGVNRALGRRRPWLGRRPFLPGQTARFAMGDRVRVKRGVAHSEYPDLPLGGWVGTIAKIVWLIPISYEVGWTEETLAAAHPVYDKRCRRDDIDPESDWLDEAQVEADSAEQPLEMEPPTNLIVRPLSADDQGDRIRMVFGLTSDDPLPAKDDEHQQQYLEYLKAHLTFPFDADCWFETSEGSAGAQEEVVVVGFAVPAPDEVGGEVLCDIRRGEKTEQVTPAVLDVDEDDPNYQYVDDYDYWLHGDYEYATSDEDEDGIYLDDEDDDDEDEEDGDWDEDEEEDYDEGGQVGFPFPGPGSGPLPLPIRRDGPQVGRNDPCPCGSGKKFKKCCLRKQGDGGR